LSQKCLFHHLQNFRSWAQIRKVIATKARQTMTKPTLRVVPPTAEIRKVTPRRPKNGEIRTREYLTEREVEQLIEGCKGNRQPHRDQTMILLAFRHGLRASELCDLQWTQVDFDHATLAVTRVKHGTPSTHPLTGRELRALRRLHRETESKSPFLFLSERGSPMTVSNFQKLINRACEAAGLKIKAHPHMLRHACGFHQANAGRDTRSLQAYLGHKNIQHTVRYTELAPTRFKGWWKD
jgi:type 1 fimbriae regulatory protein FimB/type 1 fimbriae regulatory protein FimE